MSSKKFAMDKRMRQRDIISNLHPSILCHILSLLPTKQAVRTCVLSKEWRYKWKTIYTLRLGLHFNFWGEEHSKKFAEEMLSVLLVRNVVFWHSLIFQGWCECECDSSWGETWISTLLRRNTCIESLDLKFDWESVSLPHSLLNTTSLKHLQLSVSSYRVPAKVFFPNLISLGLETNEIRNESCDNNILTFNLPVVEKIEISCCKWVNVKSVSIYAPELTTFGYMRQYFSKQNDIENIISIEIVGTNLAAFNCSDLPKNLIMNKSKVTDIYLSSLAHLDLLALPEKNDLLVRIRSLLEGFSSLRNLKLSTYWLTAITKSGFSLPKFDHLIRLCIFGIQHSEAAIQLLHATPCLKFLRINMLGMDSVNCDCDAIKYVPSCISLHLEELTINYNFITTVESPHLISHLEKVEFDYLVAQDDIFKFPKFFVKYMECR